MFLNNYSLRIVGGNEVSGGYVEMRHGQVYQITLRNNNSHRCDARVEVDGKHVGTWRLNAFSSATLEHPVHDEGKFTFYKVGTREAALVHLEAGNSDLGLIRVTFTPEKEIENVSYSYSGAASAGSYTMYKGIPETLTTNNTRTSAGGTGLSGHSDQEYGQASEIKYDYTGQTTIFLRLVCVDNDGPRPLTQFSTPLPPPVR